jgi:hypothetical protein
MYSTWFLGFDSIHDHPQGGQTCSVRYSAWIEQRGSLPGDLRRQVTGKAHYNQMSGWVLYLTLSHWAYHKKIL